MFLVLLTIGLSVGYACADSSNYYYYYGKCMTLVQFNDLSFLQFITK